MTFRWVGILLCAMVCAAATSAQAVEKSPNEWVTEADRILKKDPKDAKAYYNRGTGLYAKGDYAMAVKDLSMAIILEPKAPDAYFNRGLSHRRQRQNDEAISDFSKAIELYPAQPAYYFERCNSRIVKSDLEGAVADCSKGIELSPDEASGYLMRGVARLLEGDHDQALADSVQALQIQPDYKDAGRLLFESLLARESVDRRAHSATPPKGDFENLSRGVWTAEKR